MNFGLGLVWNFQQFLKLPPIGASTILHYAFVQSSVLNINSFK